MEIDWSYSVERATSHCNLTMPTPGRGSSGKKTRTRLTMAQQAAVLERALQGAKREELASEYDITRQGVDKIVNRQSKIEREMATRRQFNLPTDTGTRRTITSKYPTSHVDLAVHKWLLMMADNGRDLNVTGDVMAAKAMEFAEALGLAGFKASTGWLTNFKKRWAAV